MFFGVASFLHVNWISEVLVYWLKGVAVSDCSVPCKMFWEELEALCRGERLHCKELGVSRTNINDYEVEFLCDYKKNKVSYQHYNS